MPARAIIANPVIVTIRRHVHFAFYSGSMYAYGGSNETKSKNDSVDHSRIS